MLPTENAGKKWTQDTPLRSVGLKETHTMPALLLQKPSKTSKNRDHLDALERRLQLWKIGEIKSLLLETETRFLEVNIK